MININDELKIYKKVFYNSPDSMIFSDNTGKILKVNKEAIREYGYSYEEFLKLNIFNLGDINNKSKIVRGNIEFQDLNYRKNGTKFPVEVKYSYIEVDNNKFIFTIIKNITAIQKNIEDIGTLASIVESCEDAIISINSDGIIKNWNKGAKKLYGYSEYEVLDKPIYHIFKESYRDYIFNKLQDIKNNIILKNCETVMKKKDGQHISVSITASPIYDFYGCITGISIIARDITEKQELLNILNVNEERWRLALQGGNLGVWEWNIKTNEVFYSNRCKEIIGYSEDEISNRYEEWYDRVHKEDYEYVKESINKHFKGEEYLVEYRMRCKNGEYKWVRTRGKVIQYDDGNPVRMVGTNEDINEEHMLKMKLVEDENRLRGIYNFMNIGMVHGKIIFDKNGKPIDFMFLHKNKSLGKILNIKSEDIIEKNTIISLLNTEKDLFELFVYAAVSGKSGHVEKYCKKLKKYFEIDIYSPNINQFSLIVQDVTEKKKKEKELIEKYDELSAVYEELTATEEELRSNYNEIEKTNEKLEKASSIKSEFLANMSHELRTPLNGILGFTQLLQLIKLNNEQSDDLLMIKNSSQHLLKIINEILDLSKIEAGKVKLKEEKFNIRELIESSIKELYVAIQGKDIEIMYNIDPFIDRELIGDGLKLKQVLINLINNAIKFTEKGHIYFRVKQIDKTFENTKFEFSIEDTGKGISDKFKDQIFEMFSQEEGSYTKEHGGTGLGLSISKQLVKLMGGDIWFESQSGKGSIFYFTIVLKNCIEQNYFEIGSNENINKRICDKEINILVVEDNEINLKIASAFLKQLNYKYNCVRNGQEAIDYIDNNKMDIILMDIQMPILNGLEATKIIRDKEIETGEHKIIIAMTAYAMEGDCEKFLDCGMDDYISKPFDMQVLRNVIDKHIVI